MTVANRLQEPARGTPHVRQRVGHAAAHVKGEDQLQRSAGDEVGDRPLLLVVEQPE